MRWRAALRTVAGWLMAAASGTVVWSQERGGAGDAQAAARFLAAPTQVVVVRAGHLFDPKSGTLLTNQVILIRGDRITDVGTSVQVPSDARAIDLSAATVLPGMIDAHVHVFPRDENASSEARALVGVSNAQLD